MHLTLLVAGALLPGELAVALTTSLNTPTLKARLSRATCTEQAAPSGFAGAHFHWLANTLFGHAAPAPTAPYAYARLTGAAAPAFVWHADPVHMEAARDHVIVHTLGSDSPNAKESGALIAIANEFALGTGSRLIESGQRWFLLSDTEWKVDARPLSAITEGVVELPHGPDALVWSRLHNEIQMAWHAHDVNVQREADEKRTINAVWLHGGGRWNPLPPIRFAQVQSDAAELQGVAEAAGARASPVDAPMADNALFVTDDAWKARQLQDWNAWLRAIVDLDRSLTERPEDAIDLIFSGDTLRTFELRSSDRYKPWRQRTLVQAFSE
ncbi:MAG TPA: hypothetical protein VJU53_05330 [Burkholderiaceae bacterium]|nr:hypothetical protein [Burkholderiaceae bacterium]